MNPTFEAYYSSIWGDRFQGLVHALLAEKQQVALYIPKSHNGPSKEDLVALEGLPYIYSKDDLIEQETGNFYFLDLASIYAAGQVKHTEDCSIWDMCAAPGGKSFYLYNALKQNSKLLLTEVSKDRYFRLKRNFEQFTEGEYQNNTDIVQADALQWGYRHPEQYDHILLDAPCSSEQHILESDDAMRAWKPSRPKLLAKRQYGLLCSGMLALKSKGSLVYSTCSINPAENDGVIGKFLKKKGNTADWVRCDVPMGEQTQYGHLILPDHANGWGPIYISKLIKR